ncbi:MAG: imidazole glycerol phosphate synthase subunit HisH [Oligoflexia bacterium]|nr:imidazole glycerol phosphate synthase subunit HisH [Oligoflexia bacterium]
MSKSILIVDYGLGNLFNIEAAFSSVGCSVKVSSNHKDIVSADRVVIPGVGSFADGIKGLHEMRLIDPLREFVLLEKPLLGICLGMQLLLSESEEWGVHQGLGFVEGRVVSLKQPLPGVLYKIPHIGWNKMKVRQENKILKDVFLSQEQDFFMYFLHSYYADLEDTSLVMTETEYGRDTFCSSFQKNNIFGFQPHPERSGEVGLKIFQNFLKV